MKHGSVVGRTILLLAFSVFATACSQKVPSETIENRAESAVVSQQVSLSNGETQASSHMQSDTENEASKNFDIQSEDKIHSAQSKEEHSDEQPKENDNFEKCITDAFATFPGTYSYAFHDYKSGSVVSAKSFPMKAASIIKLFIMEYAYDLMAKGELKPDFVIKGNKVSSLIESMITCSDNNSTNILIDEFNMEKINSFIKSQGYSDTVLGRKMLDTAAAARGEENYTSACDVLKFLDKIYANKASYPYDEMLSVMKRQQISTKIRRDIPSGVEIASKTGELSDTDNDAGIIFTSNGDFAFVCLTGGASPEPARDCIAKSAKALYDEFVKEE